MSKQGKLGVKQRQEVLREEENPIEQYVDMKPRAFEEGLLDMKITVELS